MVHPVEKQRGHKYVGLPEFAQAGARILSELELEQERGTVTSFPDERTIRYYLAEGLIKPPAEKQGTASVFGYLNLLQLITVKQLQAEHLPIRKIRELVAGKDEQELEILLGIRGPSGKKSRENEAKRYLESLLAPSTSLRLESGGTGAPTPKPTSAPRPVAPLAQEVDQTRSWQRVEIEPGLELHIRSDYTPPTNSAKSRSLADRIRGAISRYWRAKD
jgi:DNA-binding transcriptional MerR regulator